MFENAICRKYGVLDRITDLVIPEEGLNITLPVCHLRVRHITRPSMKDEFKVLWVKTAQTERKLQGGLQEGRKEMVLVFFEREEESFYIISDPVRRSKDNSDGILSRQELVDANSVGLPVDIIIVQPGVVDFYFEDLFTSEVKE